MRFERPGEANKSPRGGTPAAVSVGPAANLVEPEAAHGRLMDTDVALVSTRSARQNILLQSGASMTAQANQLTSLALSLIG